MRSLNLTSKVMLINKKRYTAPEKSDIQTMIPTIYNRKSMYYLNHSHWWQVDASISHACASPSSPELYTWGTFTLYIVLLMWIESKNLFQTQEKKSGKKKVQGTILPESNSAIFDIWVMVNVEANDEVIFIRTLEFNVISTEIVCK